MNNLLKIGLAGDVMLGRTLDSIISQRGYNYPWGDLLPVLKSTDLNIANLETTLTHSVRKVDKVFNFKATPDKTQTLVNANFQVVNLANNHILDFDKEGLLETIETLDINGVKHVGAGKNNAAASVPSVITKNDIRIGILGLTDNEPDWKADASPGTNYIDLNDIEQIESVLHTIELLKEKTDIIIVSVHWGPNMHERPAPEYIDFAHAMIDYGANVIHGHSAHILQGIEVYNNNLILYDTGDFIDDYVVDPVLRNDLSAFFILEINKSDVIDLKIVPVCISQYQVNHAQQEDYDWVIERMQLLSSEFNTEINNTGNVNLRQVKHV